jgi:hypothetical protein
MELRLETMGKERELTGAGGVFSALAEEMERLRTALDDFAMGDSP